LPHNLDTPVPILLEEPLGIDPCVDVVFARLFGEEAHESIRLAFLNAVLAPAAPIRSARILSPIQPATFEDGKSVIVDIQAQDETGRTFQVEMQRRIDRDLAGRMLYDWSRLYADQLRRGEPYSSLRPVVSIWLCERDPFPQSKKAHLRFRLLEEGERFALHPDQQVDVLQLGRWRQSRQALLGSPLGRWFWFFNEASEWREVPPSIHTAEMEEAMAILNEFRKDESLHHLYESRLRAQRVEMDRELELKEEREGREQERVAKEAALAAKEAALAEVAALRAQLASLHRKEQLPE
jgi:predicted transposase/invertase (TIGR01784 family)